jgi:hypothetical protein
MKKLRHYDKTAQVLPIFYKTQGLALAVGSHGIFWRARTILLSLAVKNG